MNKLLLLAIILSMSPISELNGAIPVALSTGLNPFSVFFLICLFNLMVIPITFFFLDNIHHHCMKISHYERFFNYYLEKSRKKIDNTFKKGIFLVLFSFVALPSPATGAYTGTLIAWFFKLDRKHSFLAISLGVLVNGLIVTLVALGIIKLF